jgi:hypothetical protein
LRPVSYPAANRGGIQLKTSLDRGKLSFLISYLSRPAARVAVKAFGTSKEFTMIFTRQFIRQFTAKNAKNSLLGFASLITLASCSLPGVSIFQNNDTGTSLSTGDVSTVHFFTKEMNHDTGIRLEAGASYTVGVTILSNWMDSSIAINEDGGALNELGFSNTLMPLELVGVTRRSRDNQWFELMLEQPSCSRQSLIGVSELSYNDTTGSYSFTASCDGNLNLFVNDSYGFYSNNIGYANIALKRSN